MKTVYMVYFDYEVRCVAETYEDIVDYMLVDGWIDEEMVYAICGRNNMDKPDDIEKFVYEMTWEEFNDFFNGCYFLQKEEVYKREG